MRHNFLKEEFGAPRPEQFARHKQPTRLAGRQKGLPLASAPMTTDPARTLDGQVAVVTGGARGIGFAAASRLARDGARIVLFDVDGAAAETAGAVLTSEDAEVLVRQVDVMDEHAVGNAVQWVLSTAGRID